jgi:RND superfamily putative drug exporter
VMFQQMGFGLGAAVLIDATLIRSVLVPSTMKLLGKRNWYLPKWLEWLPNVTVEGPHVRSQEAPAREPVGVGGPPPAG